MADWSTSQPRCQRVLMDVHRKPHVKDMKTCLAQSKRFKARPQQCNVGLWLPPLALVNLRFGSRGVAFSRQRCLEPLEFRENRGNRENSAPS